MTHLKRPFEIDPEFRGLLPPQRPEETQRLREKIRAEGVLRGSIVVGVLAGQKLLIDGHHTLTICEEEDIDLPVPKEIPFASRDEIKDWIRKTQGARRNATEEWLAYNLGQRYLAAKQQEPFVKTESDTVGQNVPPDSRTSQTIADEHGVNEKTVRRSAEFAEAVDTIAARDGEEAKAAILSGETGQTREEVIEEAENGNPIHDHGSAKLKTAVRKGLVQEADAKNVAKKPHWLQDHAVDQVRAKAFSTVTEAATLCNHCKNKLKKKAKLPTACPDCADIRANGKPAAKKKKAKKLSTKERQKSLDGLSRWIEEIRDFLADAPKLLGCEEPKGLVERIGDFASEVAAWKGHLESTGHA